jgi:UDP-2,3-diacylglucosamine pyrophosphatase LpxH
MKSHQKSEIHKTILVVSDLHLSAGMNIHSRKNLLEDFHYDKELIEFIEYHISGNFIDREVELVINGDFFDLLAVPFVPYFDDEYWSEEAALEKLKMIVEAHKGVIQALKFFLKFPRNKLIYIIGNHDAELIFPALQNYVYSLFNETDRSKLRILLNEGQSYSPVEGIEVKHGHEFELAHHFSSQSLITDIDGNKYFLPPWGSYYVTRVINKFKEGRDYINAVRPVNKFIINGIIYDTLYTLRFMFSNFYYFLMVRFVILFKKNNKWGNIFTLMRSEIELFKNYETLTEEAILNNPNLHALVVGHTHDPQFREYDDGSIFINTGTWTKMYNLDFGKNSYGARLTYARIDVKEKLVENLNELNFDHLEITLNEWKGRNDLPFKQFRY